MDTMTHIRKPFSKVLMVINLIVLLFVLIAFIGISLSNYEAFLLIAASGLMIAISAFMIARMGWIRFFALLIILGLLAFILLPCLGLYRSGISFNMTSAFSLESCQVGEHNNFMNLISDQIIITPIDFSKGRFLVTEHIIYDQIQDQCIGDPPRWSRTVLEEGAEADLPARQITTESRGAFMREVVIDFAPLPWPTLNSRYTVSEIEVQDFPYKSFYEAQFAANLRQAEYLGKETISWAYERNAEKIRFAYIPAPFYNVSVLLTPFIEVSKYDGWMLAVIGFGINSLFVLHIKSLLSEWGRKTIVELFSKPKQATAGSSMRVKISKPSDAPSQISPPLASAENCYRSTIPAREMERLFRLAKAAFDAKNYEDTEKILRQISKEKEVQGNAQYWLLAGALRAYKKDWRSAGNCFCQARRLGDLRAEPALKWLHQMKSTNAVQ